MEVVHILTDWEREYFKRKGTIPLPEDGVMHYATWNEYFQIIEKKQEKEKQKRQAEDTAQGGSPEQPLNPQWPAEEEAIFLVVVDDLNQKLKIRYETDPKTGISWPHGSEPIRFRDILQTRTASEIRRIQFEILMNTSMFDESWCYPVLKKYFKPRDRVCVLAMSYYDDTKTLEDWNRQNAPGQGIYYPANTDVFFRFGLKREQVIWVNPFTDSRKDIVSKILNSNVLLLPGGAPDLFMKRIRERKLASLIRNYCGTVVGYSAGAMIQLADYHITPDEDYPEFSWQTGMGMIRDLDIEVHYQASRHQERSIQKAISQKHLDTWAIYERGGLIFENGQLIERFGQVEFFGGSRESEKPSRKPARDREEKENWC